MRTCRALGCQGKVLGRYSIYCPRHAQNNRRHGDPHQTSIRKHQLNPYLKLVSNRIQKNKNTIRWDVIEARWISVVQTAQAVLAGYEQGLAGFEHERRAAEAVMRVHKDANFRVIVETVAAMFLLRYLDPHLFRSDKAFEYQLVRRVKSLTDLHTGTYYNQNNGRLLRAYKTTPPKETETFARWLIKALGPLAMHFVRLEERDEEQRKAEAEFLKQPLGIE